MALTGYKQATIAYKIDTVTGAALDINGALISKSGKRQAIRILEGSTNPAPTLYEVEGYFQINGILLGESSVEYRPDACPVGTLLILPSRIIISTTQAGKVAITSSHPWTASPLSFTTISQTTGQPTSYPIDLDIAISAEGQGFVVFTQPQTGETARVYVISSNNTDLWVLDGGTWHDLGFWFDSKLWTY